MRRSWVVILTLCVSLAGSTAAAETDSSETEPDYGASGFYVYLGGATGIDVSLLDALGVSNFAQIDPAIGFNGRVGARAGGHFASELQIEYLPTFDVTALGLSAVQYSMLTITGNMKLFVLTGRFQPFLLIGGGGSFSDLTSPFLGSASFSGWSLRGGGGFQFFFNEHVALVLDASYVYPTGDLLDADYVSIGWGIQYRF